MNFNLKDIPTDYQVNLNVTEESAMRLAIALAVGIFLAIVLATAVGKLF